MSSREWPYLHPGQIQNWQAVAVLKDGREMHVALGVSSPQVRRIYLEVLGDLAGCGVERVKLRQWRGDTTCGHWKHVADLDVGQIAQEAVAA